YFIDLVVLGVRVLNFLLVMFGMGRVGFDIFSRFGGFWERGRKDILDKVGKGRGDGMRAGPRDGCLVGRGMGGDFFPAGQIRFPI
ncbi:MAG: hypothetical protein ACK55Z_13590, partial [bacterium]